MLIGALTCAAARQAVYAGSQGARGGGVSQPRMTQIHMACGTSGNSPQQPTDFPKTRRRPYIAATVNCSRTIHRMPLIPSVMPQEEQKLAHSGTPGLAVPDNAKDIKEFGEVRDVDAKDLNAKLQAADAAKTSDTPGIHIPKDAENIEAFKKVSDVDPKSLN